jgi:hypothetical protein
VEKYEVQLPRRFRREGRQRLRLSCAALSSERLAELSPAGAHSANGLPKTSKALRGRRSPIGGRVGGTTKSKSFQLGATVSALLAPRAPSGFSAPVVVSRFVWCSISAFSSAPMSTMVAENQIHVMKPIAAPSEP